MKKAAFCRLFLEFSQGFAACLVRQFWFFFTAVGVYDKADFDEFIIR
jgi:hypothetical protein